MKGGTNRGNKIIGNKNSLAFDEKVRKDKSVPRIENPKENKIRIIKKGKKGGKSTLRKIEKITIKIKPEIS